MISVVIPVYRNTDQFLKNFSHNLPYLKDMQIIVVNDYPQENLQEKLSHFKEVMILQSEKNLGFGPTVNRGVEVATNDFVFLLNSDVILYNNHYRNALKHFENNSSLFAVSFAQKEKDGSIMGKNTYYWKRGMFLHGKSRNLEFGSNGWAEGGASMIDRNKFRKLRGFDQLYAPFYWEDIDLSYRAWKSGFEILFDPDILVEHHHESTIGKYFPSYSIKCISYRNQLIFIWKNITDKHLCFSHLIMLPFYLLFFSLKMDRSFILGLLNAFIRLPVIIMRKKENRKLFKLSDREVLARFYE